MFRDCSEWFSRKGTDLGGVNDATECPSFSKDAQGSEARNWNSLVQEGEKELFEVTFNTLSYRFKLEIISENEYYDNRHKHANKTETKFSIKRKKVYLMFMYVRFVWYFVAGLIL